MKIAVIQQRKTYRGDVLPPVRIANQQYVFTWNKSLNAYSVEFSVDSLDEANLLLRKAQVSRQFTPGIALVDEKPREGVAPSHVPVPEPTEQKRKPGRPRTTLVEAP